MKIYELEEYVLDACAFLDIEVDKVDSHQYRIQIPDPLILEFHANDEFYLAFEKTSDAKFTYVTTESFFTQTLARIVADTNDGVSSGSRHMGIDKPLTRLHAMFPDAKVNVDERETNTSELLYIWFKASFQGVMLEEYLQGFVLNMSINKVSKVDEDISSLLRDISEELIETWDTERFKQAFEQIEEGAIQDANAFLSKKQHDMNAILDKEIARINEFYDNKEAENQFAETARDLSPEEHIQELRRERDGLIAQQKLKYAVEHADTLLDPVAFLLLRQQVETARVHVNGKYGKSTFDLSGDKPLQIECAVTGNKNGPYVITSDKQIVVRDRAFECSKCGALYIDTQRGECSSCRTALCSSCRNSSAISGKVLCKNHSVICASCQCLISEDEMHLCSNCNQFYCRRCTPDKECRMCSSLKPLGAITPAISTMIADLPDDLLARKYDISESGTRTTLVGKGIIFKEFLAVFDENQRCVFVQRYGAFNRKKS